MKKLLSLSAVFILAFASAGFAQPKYSVVNKFHVEGDGGWDCLSVDSKSHLLYVSHGTVVNVVDVTTGKTVGTIPNTNGVHAIAIASDAKKGYTSNGKDTTVTVFDLATLAVKKTIKVTGVNPDMILYDPFSHRVLTFNGRSSNVTVINTTSDSVIGTITLNGKPELAVSDERGKIYLNIEDKSEVAEIDPIKMKVLRYFPLAPGEEPSGIAIDRMHHRLFCVCSNNKMIVLNSRTGALVASLPIGDHPDGAGFDPSLNMAFSSNADGTITAVEEKNDSTFRVVQTIQTQKGAKTMTLSESNHHLYLSTAEFGDTPAATTEHPHPRPAIKPGTFMILDVAPPTHPTTID